MLDACIVTSMNEYSVPTAAAACRVILDSVGLAECWDDDGPGAQAAAWIATGLEAGHRPTDLSVDQWIVLQLCHSICTGRPGCAFSDLLVLERRPLSLVASYLAAVALGAEDSWPSLFSSK